MGIPGKIASSTEWCHDMETLFTLLALCEGNPHYWPFVKETTSNDMEMLSSLLALCEGNPMVMDSAHKMQVM